MVDTVRTIPEILALYADNTAGDISPQDARDMIVSLEALSPTVSIHSSVTTQGVGASGDYFAAGFYDCPVTDANLTQASTTQTHGSANGSAAAHAIVVAGAAGSTDGADLVLTVTGVSIDDSGVRTVGDSEIVVADCTASITNQFYQTTKKWLGQITYTLSSASGTAFNYDFNYGYAAYEDFANNDFLLDNFSFEWLAAANDAGFDIEVHHHKSTGWTYHATAFTGEGTSIYKMSDDHSTNRELINGQYGKWKRTGLSVAVDGSDSEGLVIHVTTSVNNSLQWCHSSINSKIQPTT